MFYVYIIRMYKGKKEQQKKAKKLRNINKEWEKFQNKEWENIQYFFL